MVLITMKRKDNVIVEVPEERVFDKKEIGWTILDTNMVYIEPYSYDPNLGQSIFELIDLKTGETIINLPLDDVDKYVQNKNLKLIEDTDLIDYLLGMNKNSNNINKLNTKEWYKRFVQNKPSEFLNYILNNQDLFVLKKGDIVDDPAEGNYKYRLSKIDINKLKTNPNDWFKRFILLVELSSKGWEKFGWKSIMSYDELLQDPLASVEFGYWGTENINMEGDFDYPEGDNPNPEHHFSPK